jgi:hypothetical protein
VSEEEWQGIVLKLAGLYGWALTYHTHDSTRSNPGWPDLVLHRPPGELLIVELKTDTGRVSKAQQTWLAALACSGVETAVWRPRDLDSVVHPRLKRRAPRVWARRRGLPVLPPS